MEPELQLGKYEFLSSFPAGQVVCLLDVSTLKDLAAQSLPPPGKAGTLFAEARYGGALSNSSTKMLSQGGQKPIVGSQK